MNRVARLALVTFLLLFGSRPLIADEWPNIILVMADDMGWSDIGCYGGEIPTPHIDRLAGQGLRFSQFSSNSICGPTRASLLTGLYCQQTGHSGSRWNDPKDFSRCATFGELLQEAGYRTMLIGKWQGRDPVRRRGTAWQLYDLQTDGGETRDVAAEHPERVEQLAAVYAQWAERVGVE